MKDNSSQVSRAVGAVGGMTLISRLFGFLRDVIIAMKFGASPAADAFFVAFRIPNIQRRILGEGAVSSALIPVFSEYRATRTPAEAWALAANVFNVLLALLFIASLALFLLAPVIIFLFAPGFLDNPEQFDLAVTLTRWMAPFLLGIGLAAFFNGLLNTMQVFALPAAAPVLLNLSMIGAALWLSPRMETPILGLAAGVILGGALQFIFVLPAARRRGFRFSRVWNWRDPGLTRMFRLMGPAVLGLAVYEVNLLVDTLLASLLPGGSISYLYYANRLVQLPLGVFGVALGVVLLPNLAGQAAKQDWVGLRETLAFGIRFVLFITIPATVGLILLREPIIHTLWERGEFTPAVTDGTAVGLLYYTVGLCAFAGSKVLTSAFYSMQDTKTPVKVGIWAMGLNIVLNLALMGPMLHGGLALATSLAAMFNAAVLLHLLRQRLGLLGGRQILRTTLKVAAAAVLMGLLVYGFNLAFFDRAAGTVYKAFILMLSIALGGMSFGVLTHWMKIEELRHFLDLKKGKPGSGIPVNGNGD